MFAAGDLAIGRGRRKGKRAALTTEELVEAAFKRTRGPKGKFSDRQSLTALLLYLAADDSTIEGAAHEFGCSKSTIEKTLARLRKATREALAAEALKSSQPKQGAA